MKIEAPPDPSAPLKLLRAGRADVAISYEPELMLARDAGATDLVSVGALVQAPLTTLMALGSTKIASPGDLAGKRVGTSGIPYQSAYLKTILSKARVDPATVKETNVGFNLVPAMLTKKVDATLGAFWNYEGVDLQQRGKKPTILRMERLGVPTYDELVLVANKTRLRRDAAYRSEVKRFVGAFLAGTADARRHPVRAIAILQKVTASDPRFLARATPATLRRLTGPKGIGCISVDAWQRFGDWMRAQRLLKKPIPAAAVVDVSLLPSRCR